MFSRFGPFDLFSLTDSSRSSLDVAIEDLLQYSKQNKSKSWIAFKRLHSDIAKTARWVLSLCHHKPRDEEIYKLSNWFSPQSKKTPTILCHGHDHGDPGLYAKHHLRMLNGVSLHMSHVYSANTSNRGQKIGAGNLIEVADNSEIRIRPVDISSLL